MPFNPLNFAASFFTNNSTLRQCYTHWVVGAALIGGVISGLRKTAHISNEPEPKYKNEVFEKPMYGVYHTTRIAAHCGLGAFVGGGLRLLFE